MATVRLYLDKRRAKKNGEYSIRIIVFHNKDIILSTPHSCLEKEWKDNKLTKSVVNYQAKNASITAQMLEYENIILDLERDNILHTLSDKQLKDRLTRGRKSKIISFFDIFNEVAEKRASQGSRDVYMYSLRKVKAYDPNASFQSIDVEWLNDFVKWMTDDGLSQNTRASILRPIRTTFNYALDRDLITNYPFRKFRFKKVKTRSRDLSKEQVQDLIKYDGKYNNYRDFFMLSFYLCGMNMIDLLNAKKSDVRRGRLEYSRRKTKTLYNIKIEPEAMEIIERYPDEEYLVSFIRNHEITGSFKRAINLALKTMTNKEGDIIDERLSTYYARHTWATLASHLEIPKETISAGLGHKFGSEMTEDYINFDQKKIDKANRMIIDYVNQ